MHCLQEVDESLIEVKTILSVETEKEAARADRKKACIGFGAWKITKPADGHTGPALTPRMFNQRQVTDKAVKNLADIISRNGREVYDIKNVLTVGIRRKWVDSTKLVKPTALQTLGDHSRIAWTAEAMGQTALLLNGQHRIEANMLPIKKAQLRLEEITKTMCKFTAGEDKYIALDRKLDELNNAIEKLSYWGVELIDLGKLLQSSYK